MVGKNLYIVCSYWLEILTHVVGSIVGLDLLRTIVMAMIVKIMFDLGPVAIPVSTYRRDLPIQPTYKEQFTKQAPSLFCY